MTACNKADLLVLGNVITMDERKPRAEAVAVRGDRIIYVGPAEIARKLCDGDTKVCDFGRNTVYPGFLEAHCHPGGAGYMATGLAHLDRDASLEDCVRVMKEFIDANPGRKLYAGIGFATPDELPTAAMLDAICPDVPVALTDYSGHAMWLNTKALQAYGITKETIGKWDKSCVALDEDGNPSGYIAEGPVFHVRASTEITLEQMLDAAVTWQHISLSSGYTAAYNAGIDLVSKYEADAYQTLDREGRLKTYILAGKMVQDNTDTPEDDIAKIAEEAQKSNSRHYRLIGAKVFADGTIEAHTAWMLEDYIDTPGFRGVRRFDDHDKMVRLVKAAGEHGLNVHVHTIGDGAATAWVDAMAQAAEESGNFDMRNTLAHLQVIPREYYRRFADYNITPAAGVMWAELTKAEYKQDMEYVGPEITNRSSPVKSFLDAGANMVSHSDFPVSPAFSVPHAICLMASRQLPSHGKVWIMNPGEVIGRMDALRALTVNVAYSWHLEDEMGSLEVGKLANIAVFDKDFLDDDLSEVENAKCLATFVDGELVYKA